MRNFVVCVKRLGSLPSEDAAVGLLFREPSGEWADQVARVDGWRKIAAC